MHRIMTLTEIADLLGEPVHRVRRAGQKAGLLPTGGQSCGDVFRLPDSALPAIRVGVTFIGYRLPHESDPSYRDAVIEFCALKQQVSMHHWRNTNV